MLYHLNMFRIAPLIFHLVSLALPTLAPAASTLLPMPQSPTTIPSPQQLGSLSPMVSPNARWPAPLSLWHLHSLQLQCQDMLCLPSRIPSLGWVPLLTKDAPLSSLRQQSLSTIPMDIPFLQAGASKLARASGTSRSPNKEQPPWLWPSSQHRWKPSHHHHRVLGHHP